MKTKKKFYLGAILIAVLFWTIFCCETVLAAKENSGRIPEPTVLSAVQIKDADNSQIMVNGIMPVYYNVVIYINGKYEGLANISQITNDFVRFSFLSKPMDSSQNFEVMAIGQDKISLNFSAPTIASVKSVIEKRSLVAIIDNQPAKQVATSSTAAAVAVVDVPTINVTGQNICIPSPNVYGSVKSQNQTHVFIDNKLSVVIPANKQSVSTSTYSYSPAGLERGQHLVYVIAQDDKGNKSAKSKTLSFCVSYPQIITAATSTEKTEKIEQAPTSSLVFQKTTNKSKPNSDKNKKHSNTPNIIIFTVFIICLGAWIILVNKELATEKDKTDRDKNNQ